MSKKLYQQFSCSRMMLPEHREILNLHRAQVESDEAYRSPEHDQQQWEQFEQLVKDSLYRRSRLQITILSKNGYYTLLGTVRKLDSYAGMLNLYTGTGVKVVVLKDIVSLEAACQELDT